MNRKVNQRLNQVVPGFRTEYLAFVLGGEISSTKLGLREPSPGFLLT